jgi:hypothetical protein
MFGTINAIERIWSSASVEAAVVAGSAPFHAVGSCPKLFADAVPMIVLVRVLVALDAVVDSGTRTAKPTVADRMATVVLHVFLTAVSTPVGIADTGAVRVPACMRYAPNTVEVRHPRTATVTPLLAVRVDWNVAVDSAKPVITNALS